MTGDFSDQSDGQEVLCEFRLSAFTLQSFKADRMPIAVERGCCFFSAEPLESVNCGYLCDSRGVPEFFQRF